MNTIYFNFGTIILCSLRVLTEANPIEYEKSFSDNTNKLHCIDSNDVSDYEKNNPNSYADFYKPRPRFESLEKNSYKPVDYRSSGEMYGNVAKRQVGVVFKDDKPIGILQPSQRSYRFIPVNEDTVYGGDVNKDQESFNFPSVGVDKREVNMAAMDPSRYLQETYPSILTNFKIDNKLDKKRNYDGLTDDNVQELKATIRRLRSSNPYNTDQIEEELKNILDDMGLIEEDEVHGSKREVSEDNEDEEPLQEEAKSTNDRSKRDEPCSNIENADSSNKLLSEHNFLTADEKKNEFKNNAIFHSAFNKREPSEQSAEPKRAKRQKQEQASNNENAQLIENLKESGNLMVSGNKSPLAASSEINVRQAQTGNKDSDEKYVEENDDQDYQKRIERQIQSKINSLKEEVKREIANLRQQQSEDEDTQRKKRQIGETLVEEESEEVDPTLNVDVELKPLIRKRRHVLETSQNNSSSNSVINVRRKRDTDDTLSRNKRSERSSDIQNQKSYKTHHDDNEDGGDLLGGDDFEGATILKRNAVHGHSYLPGSLHTRNKRSRYGDNYFRKTRRERFAPVRSNRLRRRFRRRISKDPAMANRPQQLSDMSDIDLFGALPKNYDGALTRYKRVKRK